MIKFHPDTAVLKQFAAGELPDSISVIVASHVEMCPHCQKVVELENELLAKQAFDNGVNTESETYADIDTVETLLVDDEFASMIASITSDTAVTHSTPAKHSDNEITVNGQTVSLPRALNSIRLKEWSGIGKLSRSRLELDDDNLRASLLHIDKGGQVPTHTHKGFEITLLLQGSFKDEMGTYKEGDFVWLNGEHTHNPVSEEGCVCLTVSSDALHFTEGMSKLFNPIGKLIY
ncbi:ChrR family anti-sigma-E factor [Vibrio mexicanus]|uniref:ChrR family anti-sigma-E factor n=1 Tax=Vibrio mexicanus TaxID=1004326 RepID=UPI00063CC083|nr:ChrR family anti-sigma-E factor [Vibrio mexicanus]